MHSTLSQKRAVPGLLLAAAKKEAAMMDIKLKVKVQSKTSPRTPMKARVSMTMSSLA